MARILFIMPYLQAVGGTERVVAGLAERLGKKHLVQICTLSADEVVDLAALPFPVSVMQRHRRLPLALRWISYVAEARWLRSVKRDMSADVSISNLWRADLINVLSRGSDRKVSILHAGVVGWHANATLARFRRLAAPVYGAFDRVVAVSSEIRREAISLYALHPEQVTTIPNAFEPAQHRRPASSKLDVIWCGRFVDEKNPLAAVEVLKALVRSDPALATGMVGNGPLLAQCRELAGVLGSDRSEVGKLALLGAVPDAASLIRSSRLLISTSKSESFGLVLLEAMSQGVPVVAADAISGGPHEVLGAQSPHDPARLSSERASGGFLLPIPSAGTASINLWVETILSILNDPRLMTELKAGALSRSAAFSPAGIDRQWNELLSALS